MSERDVWSGKQEFHGDTNDYIRTRVLMLAAIFNRKASDEMTAVFCEVLRGYPFTSLSKGFSKAERTLERFPTPKQLREICNEEMPSNAWMYSYKDVAGTDPETGRPVKIKIDPVNNDKLYRADDCPEGRRFLAELGKLRKRKLFREPGIEG